MNSYNLGNWTIDIDVEATRKFYQRFYAISDGCGCSYCINYVKACESYSKDIKDFFSDLGIIPTKEAEVYSCGEIENGRILYSGFYHIVGRIINGEDCWNPVDSNTKVHNLFQLSDDFNFGFTYDTNLVPDGFPKPVIQMEFESISLKFFYSPVVNSFYTIFPFISIDNY